MLQIATTNPPKALFISLKNANALDMHFLTQHFFSRSTSSNKMCFKVRLVMFILVHLLILVLQNILATSYYKLLYPRQGRHELLFTCKTLQSFAE